MKLIIKGRGCGKTTRLIYASEATGYPIATTTHASVELIKEMANRMGCDIPEPITYSDLINKRHRGNKRYDNVLADDVNYILQYALNEYLNCNVCCATMTNTLY